MLLLTKGCLSRETIRRLAHLEVSIGIDGTCLQIGLLEDIEEIDELYAFIWMLN